MSVLTRVVGILLTVALLVAIVLLSVWDRRRRLRHADHALDSLGARLGMVRCQEATSVVQHFRDHTTMGCPLRLGAGTVQGTRVEICFLPILRRGIGRTMVGVRSSSRAAASLALTRRDAATALTHSFLGQPNGVGSRPAFGRYDAWGPADAIERVFTREIREMIQAFPHVFEQILIHEHDVVLMWPGIEKDAEVVGQAIAIASRLAGSSLRPGAAAG